MRNKVSVPSFGDSFFIKDMLEDEAISLEKVFPSPYSGILFLSERKVILCYQNSNCFRPLIRGFFFYGYEMYELSGNRYSFRPLIRGFFFYGGKISLQYRNVAMVSVPSFGDSFFIKGTYGWYADIYVVSVPSFGDSFFSEYGLNVSYSSLNGFRPLIRGFFFYKYYCGDIEDVNDIVSVPSFGDSFFIRF